MRMRKTKNEPQPPPPSSKSHLFKSTPPFQSKSSAHTRTQSALLEATIHDMNNKRKYFSMFSLFLSIEYLFSFYIANSGRKQVNSQWGIIVCKWSHKPPMIDTQLTSNSALLYFSNNSVGEIFCNPIFSNDENNHFSNDQRKRKIQNIALFIRLSRTYRMSYSQALKIDRSTNNF